MERMQKQKVPELRASKSATETPELETQCWVGGPVRCHTRLKLRLAASKVAVTKEGTQILTEY